MVAYSFTITDYFTDFTVSGVCSISSLDNPCGPSSLPFVVEETNVFDSILNESADENIFIKNIDSEPPLSLDFSVNQPICGCDGNITLIAENGYPPYTFSINGNLTTKNFPFFDNICSGNYYLIVNDISGNCPTNFVVLNLPSDPITYTIQLNTFSSIVQNNTTQKIVSYNNTFSVFPTLPEGITITFDLSHSSNLQSSPNFSSGTISTYSVLNINGTGITPSITAVTSGSGVNTIIGCQNETLYFKSIGEIWSSIQLTSVDTISLTTQTTLTKIEDVSCYFGDFDDSFSIINLSISGCGCCNIITPE